MQGKTILVVDDETDIVEMISYNLRKEGFGVLCAYEGQKAIELAVQCRPDAVVLDVMMPTMDGFDVCRILRSTPATISLPILFLTARSGEQDEIRGLELGADDYIQKPVSPRLLLARVRHQVEKKQQTVQKIEDELMRLHDNISTALPHEFRTSLNGILGGANLLLGTMKHDQDYLLSQDGMYEVVQAIQDSGMRLQRIAENFLFYTKLQALQSSLEAVNNLRSQILFSPREVIGDTAIMAARKQSREQDLVIHVQDLPVHITYEALHKIILELTDNALKFSLPGTPVKVSASIVQNMYHIAITDGGHGMTHEQIKNIAAYNQFQRDRHEQQGTGLGLIIAKLLVEMFDGAIYLESDIGNGTCVRLSLPLAIV